MRYYDVSAATTILVMGVRSLSRVGFVLHSTSGTNSREWLQGGSATNGEPASTDYLVGRIGETFRLIPSGHYAYHSGQSSTDSVTNDGNRINEQYYGIEVENNDLAGEYPVDVQYQCVASIIRVGSWRHNLSPPKIYAHSGIALPEGRRSDPVRFDYGRMFHYSTYPTRDMLTLEQSLASGFN